MERLIILVGRLRKSIAPTEYLFKVPLVGRFMPLTGVIRRPVESPLERPQLFTHFSFFQGNTSHAVKHVHNWARGGGGHIHCLGSIFTNQFCMGWFDKQL